MEKAKSEFNKKITPIRDSIDDIDSKILSLLAERYAQVEKIVKLKKEHNIAIYHPAREEDLIFKLRTKAEKKKLDPDFIEDIYRMIIRRSRVSQTDRMKHKGIKSSAKIVIIGGKGQMGGLFSSLFMKSGYQVEILEIQNWQNAKKICENTDLVLISVPIEKTIDIIQKVSSFIEPSTILADLTSIKEKPLKAMIKFHSGPVLGLHPLFGPTINSFDKQIIIATPGRDDKNCQWLIDQFLIWGSVIVRSSAKEHDEIMEIVQALRHFATFCFGSFLTQKKQNLERTLEFSSPIYRLETGMVGRLFAQDASLYSEIIFATKQRRRLLKEYISSFSEHIDMLEDNNKDLFIKKFNEVAHWFGPFSEQAMRESDFLINKLIERF